MRAKSQSFAELPRYRFDTAGHYLPGDVIALVLGDNHSGKYVHSLRYLSMPVPVDTAYCFYRSPAGDSKVSPEQLEQFELEMDILAEISTDPVLSLHIADEVRRARRVKDVTTTYAGQKQLVLSAIKRLMIQQKRWEFTPDIHEKAKAMLSTIEGELSKAFRRAETAALRDTLVMFASEGAVHLGFVTIEINEDGNNEFASKYEITQDRLNLSEPDRAAQRNKDVIYWLCRNYDVCTDVLTRQEIKILNNVRDRERKRELIAI